MDSILPLVDRLYRFIHKWVRQCKVPGHLGAAAFDVCIKLKLPVLKEILKDRADDAESMSLVTPHEEVRFLIGLADDMISSPSGIDPVDAHDAVRTLTILKKLLGGDEPPPSTETTHTEPKETPISYPPPHTVPRAAPSRVAPVPPSGVRLVHAGSRAMHPVPGLMKKAFSP